MSNINDNTYNPEILKNIEDLPRQRKYKIREGVLYLRQAVESAHGAQITPEINFEPVSHMSSETEALVKDLSISREQQNIQNLTDQVNSFYTENPLYDQEAA